MTSNRTIDDGNNGYLFFVDLEDTGKKSQILMNPGNPNILVQANDGSGNICAYTVGSANINLQFTGTADLRINNAPGTNGQVLTSTGTGTAPTWENPGARRIPRWSHSDFEVYQNSSNSPFVGTAVSGGNSTGSLAGELFTQTGFGWVILRSSATANSGFRWDNQSPLTQINPGVTFRAIFDTKETVVTDSDRQAWFGFKDDTLDEASPAQGVFFHLDGFNLIPTVVRNSTTTTGTAQTLSADTTYMIEFTATSSTSIDFELFAAPDGSAYGSSIQTWTVAAGTAFNQNTQMRAGMAAINVAGGANNALVALDYMGFGFR